MVLPIATSGRVESVTCWTCCRTAACESGPMYCARAACDANATATSAAYAETTGRPFMVPSWIDWAAAGLIILVLWRLARALSARHGPFCVRVAHENSSNPGSSAHFYPCSIDGSRSGHHISPLGAASHHSRRDGRFGHRSGPTQGWLLYSLAALGF